MSQKILVIAPHMDDEVLGVGGSIVKYVAAGDTVKVCFVCNRAYDHQYKKELIDKEKENALAAKQILGYQEEVFLDLNDEQLDQKQVDVIVPLEKAINDFKPKVVYLPHRFDSNQDHRAVFQAALVALRTFSTPFVKEVYSYEVFSATEQVNQLPERAFIPQRYIDISKTLEKKKEALTCYQKEIREFPHPRSEKAIEVLAMKRGVEAGLAAAEAFAIIRQIEE